MVDTLPDHVPPESPKTRRLQKPVDEPSEEKVGDVMPDTVMAETFQNSYPPTRDSGFRRRSHLGHLVPGSPEEGGGRNGVDTESERPSTPLCSPRSESKKVLRPRRRRVSNPSTTRRSPQGVPFMVTVPGLVSAH